ncbi:MAG: DNA polymerase III subunit beta [Gammaproteobacteria bacterium]|nr:DNA polymerase III subunit beta [Gammaproteobacteria bacterium]
MQFSINREALLKPLQLATGVVERRNTLPVLSNILLQLNDNKLSITGTDTEQELTGRVKVDSTEGGEITVPSVKMLEICRAFNPESKINVKLTDNKLVITSGKKSRYSLATLPAVDYPRMAENPDAFQLLIEQNDLRKMLEATSFAMAVHDVRYYLNGMLLEVAPDYLRLVATDGHRLAMETKGMTGPVENTEQRILSRKGVEQLMKLLQEASGQVDLSIGQNHIQVSVTDFTYTSKLVEGKYPNYDRVIPKGGDRVIIGECEQLKQSFLRAGILSNEKFNGVRVSLTENQIKIQSNNPDQEEGIETLEVKYTDEPMEIGFNVKYIIDVLSAITTKEVKMILSDPDSSVLVEEEQGSNALFVVMPMRL